MPSFTANSTCRSLRSNRRGLFLWCWAGAFSALVGPAFASERPRLSAEQVLIEWRTVNAETAAERTRLRITATGLVETWDAGSDVCRREQRTPEHVRELVIELEAMVGENLSSDAIRQQLSEQSRMTGLSFTIARSDDSVVRLRNETTVVEIRCPAPLLLANRFPEASRLQQFVRMERRLANLHSIVQCGGHSAAESVCALANDRLRSEHPAAAPWTIADLMMARTSRDGGRFAQFRRDEQGDECWTTCVTEFPGRSPRVSVIPPASRVR